MISSIANPKLKLIRNLQARRAVREAEGLFVVEGVRLIQEAVRAPGAPQLVLYVDGVAPGWDGLAQRLSGLALWLAEARAGQPYQQVDWRLPSALIIGAEAAGPSQAARRLAPGRVSIPMPGRAESLNAAVAGGIILFE